MRELAIIYAVARNGVIGRGGQLPWSYPEDRARYEDLTRGHAVIMGRRTFEEQGVPLPGRHNVVVSKTFVAPDGVDVAPDLDAALELAYRVDPSPFVIGGAKLFESAMPRVTRVFVTEIPESPEGDTTFRLDEAPFREISRETTPSGLVFRVLQRDSGVRIQEGP